MRVKITKLVNKREKMKHLGLIYVKPELLPSENDKLYFKGIKQLTVLERHFNLMEGDTLWDVELFVEETSEGNQTK